MAPLTATTTPAPARPPRRGFRLHPPQPLACASGYRLAHAPALALAQARPPCRCAAVPDRPRSAGIRHGHRQPRAGCVRGPDVWAAWSPPRAPRALQGPRQALRGKEARLRPPTPAYARHSALDGARDAHTHHRAHGTGPPGAARAPAPDLTLEQAAVYALVPREALSIPGPLSDIFSLTKIGDSAIVLDKGR